jgi:hypothetical protein
MSIDDAMRTCHRLESQHLPMNRFSRRALDFVAAFAMGVPSPLVMNGADPAKIVLVAGEVKQVDKPGHHDYLGGCRLMAALLRQSEGIEPVLVEKDWPADEVVFEGAEAVVFYTDGGGKQAYLSHPGRIARIEDLVKQGAGLTLLHQAVEFSPAFAKQSLAWSGAAYTPLSARGHWDSSHDSFPGHPVSRGVIPWKINDGWLNRLHFVDGMTGITPLVWSSKTGGGAPGGTPDIVAWTYDRPDGGRSFSFSGLDAHAAWELEGMRRLVINGILWSAGLEIPAAGAPCAADKALIDSFLTPRTPPPPKVKKP